MRGREVSRIEGFSDAVFGFTLTLLVVTTAVPENYSDLRNVMVGFPAFAVTFAIISWIWYEHYLFFRRYPLEDATTIALNSVLLFVVMFYAYPLKFVFTRLVGSLLGTGPGIQQGMTGSDGRILMLVYSAGFLALFSVMCLLHLHALRRREQLQLTPLDVYDARANVNRHLINVGLGTASIALAAGPDALMPFSGLIYFLLGPLHGGYGYYNGRRRERFERGAIMKKTFWDSAAREDLCRRMEALTADATPQWGQFNATQMLSHLNDAMRMAMGEVAVQPKKASPLRYAPLKQLLVYTLPWPKGAPTAPELLARGSSADFAREKAEFRSVVDRLAKKRANDVWPEHPAFGPLTYRAWGVLKFRHADHHLRQFGL